MYFNALGFPLAGRLDMLPDQKAGDGSSRLGCRGMMWPDVSPTARVGALQSWSRAERSIDPGRTPICLVRASEGLSAQRQIFTPLNYSFGLRQRREESLGEDCHISLKFRRRVRVLHGRVECYYFQGEAKYVYIQGI